MDVHENVTCETFAGDVFVLVLSEIECLREELGSEDIILSRQNIENFSTFYERIVKATCFFALKNRKNVKLAMKQIGVNSSSSSVTLEDFIKRLVIQYLHRVHDLMPKEYFPDDVLMLCGAIGSIADCCYAVEKEKFLDVCYNSLKEYIRTLAKDLADAGGWQCVYEAAEEFALEYDSHYLANETDVAEDLQA